MLAILGAGGHAKVVIGAAEAAGYEIGTVLDDREERWGQQILGHRVAGPIDQAAVQRFDASLVAIGDNSVRREIVSRIDSVWATLVHPSARIHPSASLKAGSVIFAGVIVQPDARVGEHCIVNTGATIDHDCKIDHFSHIGPGVHLAGDVRVGAGALIGIGAVAAPGVVIGERAVVGAGAVVISDVAEDTTVVGVPARPLVRRRNRCES